MSDLKPIGVKAPLNLIPLRPLRAIAAAMEHGATKYAPWNWQDVERPQAEIAELYAALLRHTLAASDPGEDDFDDESGLHHITHAGACIMLLLYKLGTDYAPSRLLEDMGCTTSHLISDGTMSVDTTCWACASGVVHDECPAGICAYVTPSLFDSGSADSPKEP